VIFGIWWEEAEEVVVEEEDWKRDGYWMGRSLGQMKDFEENLTGRNMKVNFKWLCTYATRL
jgi:hypothetical protein